MNKLDILRKCDLFHGLTDEELRVIEKLCTAKVFEAGAIICKQGKALNKIHVIEEGLVGIIREVGPLAQRQVQAASKFDVVGWSALVEPRVCTATVKAIQRTKVLSFDKQDIDNLCSTHPELGCKVSSGLARVVARRLTEAYTQLLGVTYQE